MLTHDLCHSLTVSAYKQFYPLRASESNDWVERSILIEKTERSDTTNLQYSIANLQFPDKAGFTLRYNRLVRVGIYFDVRLVSHRM
jgi:hypothetical protein